MPLSNKCLIRSLKVLILTFVVVGAMFLLISMGYREFEYGFNELSYRLIFPFLLTTSISMWCWSYLKAHRFARWVFMLLCYIVFYLVWRFLELHINYGLIVSLLAILTCLSFFVYPILFFRTKVRSTYYFCLVSWLCSGFVVLTVVMPTPVIIGGSDDPYLVHYKGTARIDKVIVTKERLVVKYHFKPNNLAFYQATHHIAVRSPVYNWLVTTWYDIRYSAAIKKKFPNYRTSFPMTFSCRFRLLRSSMQVQKLLRQIGMKPGQQYSAKVPHLAYGSFGAIYPQPGTPEWVFIGASNPC